MRGERGAGRVGQPRGQQVALEGGGDVALALVGRLGLGARRLLGGQSLARGLRAAALAQVVDLDERGEDLAVGLAHAPRQQRHGEGSDAWSESSAAVGVSLPASASASSLRTAGRSADATSSSSLAPAIAFPPVWRSSTGLARTTVPSASTTAAPGGSEAHAARRSSSERARARLWRSSSQKTETLERRIAGSKGLRT